MSGCNADTNANALFTALTQGTDFNIPNPDFSGDGWDLPSGSDSDIFKDVVKLTPADVTEQNIKGNGAFDVFMNGMNAQLVKEFDAGRITGNEYTKAFIALAQVAMGSAVQFTLQKDQMYWQAVQTQAQTIAARVAIEQSKVQVAALQMEALNNQANFALTKMKLDTEEAAYCSAEYNLTNILPAQLALSESQKAGQDLDNQTKQYQLDTLLPIQAQHDQAEVSLLDSQKDQTDAQTALIGVEKDVQTYNLNYALPAQTAQSTAQTKLLGAQYDTQEYQLSTVLPANVKLIVEQTEVQHAQTSDTRIDGQPVNGILGEQKQLYAQQIISYQRDAEVKAAKLFTDAWVTMKTVDDGLDPPTNFANDSLNDILQTLKNRNDFSGS